MQANYSKSMGAPKVPKVEWSDIGGLDHVKTEIIKTVQLPLKHPEYFTVAGLKRSGAIIFCVRKSNCNYPILRYSPVWPPRHRENSHSKSRRHRMQFMFSISERSRIVEHVRGTV